MAIETYFDGATTIYLGKGDVGLVPAQNDQDKAICLKLFNTTKRKSLGKSSMSQEDYNRMFFPITLQFSSPEDIDRLVEVLKVTKSKFKG